MNKKQFDEFKSQNIYPIAKHLNNIDPYLIFKGSNREIPVRKGLVDLIIPNAAGPKVLGRLIKSLMDNLTYTLKNSKGESVGGIRIIVVSQGECGSHVLLQNLQKQYPDVIYPIYKDVNFPPPIPYNDGMEYSAVKMNPLSEYIMFLDDDMVVLQPGLIEKELEHLEKYDFANVATEHCFFGDKSKLGPNGDAKDFGMGSFFFRRKLFEQVGYLDEYFKFHCSDTDFNRRVRLKKHKIAVIPDTEKLMFHEHQQGTHNFFKGRHQHIIDNDWVMFRKKWYDHGHPNDDIDFNCEECNIIAKTQLPLGRINYLYG